MTAWGDRPQGTDLVAEIGWRSRPVTKTEGWKLQPPALQRTGQVQISTALYVALALVAVGNVSPSTLAAKGSCRPRSVKQAE
jgi:hypothetical protein